MSVAERMFPKVDRGPAASNGASGNGAQPQSAGATSELAERRDRLAEQLAELQFDLGGLAYEMAIRDYYRVDTLTLVAAKLQELDAELGEVERMLRIEQGGAAGTCPECGALRSRGAAFCWQCGTELLETVQPAG